MSTGKVENISSRKETTEALIQALRAARVILDRGQEASERAGGRIEGAIRLRVEGQEDMATRRKRFAVRKDWSRQR